jgi:hypothetical protein
MYKDGIIHLIASDCGRTLIPQTLGEYTWGKIFLQIIFCTEVPESKLKLKPRSIPYKKEG